MTFTGVRPGPRSMQALSWLGRVGATPAEPFELVLGVGERAAYDHVRRLEAAGLVKRVPMRRGQGSLIVLTRAGALEAGYPASRAPRSITPMTWAHTSACAWVSAWLEVRGRAWWSEREIVEDDFWRFPVRYQDRRGTARMTHRPDLAAQTGSGSVAIEVELHRKNQARLYGILSMYSDMTDGDEAPLAGVIYVTGNADVDNIVRRTASRAWLAPPALSFRTLDLVIAQTREARLPQAISDGRCGPATTRQHPALGSRPESTLGS